MLKKSFGILLAACGAIPVYCGALQAQLDKCSSGGKVVIDRELAVGKNTTVPAGVTLEFAGKGKLNISKSAVVTINGVITAAPVEIFSGAGTVAGSPKNTGIPVQWFGAKGDGESDDTAALKKAAELAAKSSGRKLLIPQGRYPFSGIIPIRCNIDCRGVLVKKLAIDPAKTVVSQVMFTPTFYPESIARLDILPDEEPIQLDPASVGQVDAGSFKISSFGSIKTKDGKAIELLEGGTLRFYSSDYCSSRLNQKSDEFYTLHDYCQIVSPNGDVYPEFFFSYGVDHKAPAWSAEKIYKRGDYCTKDGAVFKAAYTTGPGSSWKHPHLGKIEIGAVAPDAKVPVTHCKFKYSNGKADKINAWVRIESQIEYIPPQQPITIDNLTIEIYGVNPEKETRPVDDRTMWINRSNVTFNRLSVSCKDKYTMPCVLTNVNRCANVVFNNSRWSGATFHGLGYNIHHGTVANITYNNCISVNARDAIAGMHGKNVTVNGGHWGCIDDHYGMNYTIKNASINSLSTHVPGYCTPKADVSKWSFKPRVGIIIGGKGNVRIENCRFYNTCGIFANRADIGDLGGNIIIRDCLVKTDSSFWLVCIDVFGKDKFDYAHTLKVPCRVVIDNVAVDGRGRRDIRIMQKQGAVLPLFVSNCDKIGRLDVENIRATFSNCGFANTRFFLYGKPVFNFLNCTFEGNISGLADKNIGYASGNFAARGAKLSWKLNQSNPVWKAQ